MSMSRRGSTLSKAKTQKRNPKRLNGRLNLVKSTWTTTSRQDNKPYTYWQSQALSNKQDPKNLFTLPLVLPNLTGSAQSDRKSHKNPVSSPKLLKEVKKCFHCHRKSIKQNLKIKTKKLQLIKSLKIITSVSPNSCGSKTSAAKN